MLTWTIHARGALLHLCKVLQRAELLLGARHGARPLPRSPASATRYSARRPVPPRAKAVFREKILEQVGQATRLPSRVAVPELGKEQGHFHDAVVFELGIYNVMFAKA